MPLQVSHLRLERPRSCCARRFEAGEWTWLRPPPWLRDGYEGTFLQGPYFNAARPDFMTLCMDSHPSGFTWGNTASSAGCVLPSDERPPYLWWAASTPCTSVYVPVFVDALGQVAEQQARCARGAGAARVCAGELRQAGACARSLAGGRVVRWTFQRLLDVVKGDALGRAFTDRQPQVRAAFDPLETVWRAETHDLLARAAHERTQRGRDAAAEVLAAFTRRCVDEALATADRLLERFSRGRQPAGHSALQGGAADSRRSAAERALPPRPDLRQRGA